MDVVSPTILWVLQHKTSPTSHSPASETLKSKKSGFLQVYLGNIKKIYYTRCNNLIPGIALWKQNLLTCALAAAVAFEILSFWSYALRKTMVPLPENSLENRFPEYLAGIFSRCVGCQKSQQIFVFLGHFLILKRAKNRRGLSHVNKVDGPLL